LHADEPYLQRSGGSPVILFAHSNFMVQDDKQMARMRPYAPLSTLIAAALLRREGHDVALFDATFALGIDAFERTLRKVRPSAVAIMEDNFNFLTKMCTTVRRESALAMIRLARASGCHVAVNGPDASDNPAAYFAAGAQAVIEGEGETPLLRIAELWSCGDTDLRQIPGLVLPDTGTTGPHRAQRHLDALPLPAWDLLDVASYRRAWGGELSWSIAASRGCPYACNWCAKPTFGRRYTVRSPHNVVEEMAALKRDIAPAHLWFTDDILGLDPEWIDAFAAEVERRDARVPFSMQTRVNLVTPRVAAGLARAGATEVWLGVESGSQRILDAMDKGTKVEGARTATRLLRQEGIRVCWFIQLGYPSEEWDDIVATRDLIRDELPDDIGVSVAYPLPGTVFYDRVRAQLGAQRNWHDTGDLAMLFQGTYETGFYRRIRDLLHREVETGKAHMLAWEVLEREAHRWRSPAPMCLVAGS
jgi:anaerobic magnesium-protoporphyrin IX monomethyl ester cyclase